MQTSVGLPKTGPFYFQFLVLKAGMRLNVYNAKPTRGKATTHSVNTYQTSSVHVQFRGTKQHSLYDDGGYSDDDNVGDNKWPTERIAVCYPVVSHLDNTNNLACLSLTCPFL